MRVLTERFRDRELDLTDGIKVFDERGWAQVLPDPDEPLVHIYAEGDDRGGLGGARGRVPRAGRGDHADGGGSHGLRRKSQVQVDPLPGAASMLSGPRPRKAARGTASRPRKPLRRRAEGADRRPDARGERGLLPAAAPAREDRHPARGARRAAPEDRRGRASSTRSTSTRSPTSSTGKAAPPRLGEPHLLPGVRLPEPGVRELLRALRRAARQGRGRRRDDA